MQVKAKTAAALIAAVLLLSDQAVKYLFSGSLSAYCNPNGPWGMPVDNGLLIVVMTAVLSGAAYLFRKTKTVVPGIALALIVAGGLSNIIDRIVSGCVRDFSLVAWFPAFNPADVYLTIGAAVLIGHLFLQYRAELTEDRR